LAVQVLQVVGTYTAVAAAAEALGGLGGVLGDVTGDLLGREFPRLVAVLPGYVAHVQLLTPPGTARPVGNEFCVLHPNFPELLARRRPWITYFNEGHHRFCR